MCSQKTDGGTRFSCEVNEQPVLDKEQTSTQRCSQLCVCETEDCTSGLYCSLLVEQNPKAERNSSRRGQLWCWATAVGPLLLNVTFCSLLLFFPDNKHSSGRQQKAGHRPCAILVRHTPLLRASWTKRLSSQSCQTRKCNFQEIHNTTPRCPFKGTYRYFPVS